MNIKILSVVIATVCFAQAAVAGDALNVKYIEESSVAAASAVSAPIQLTDVEMDKVTAGAMLILNSGHGFLINTSNGAQSGASFIRTNPANGAFICKNICF